MCNNKIISFIFLLSIASYSFAGDLQGGGGGRTNSAIKTYLDTRLYGLHGADRQVVPNIGLTNACIDGNTVHTIEPVWQCREFEIIEEPIENEFFKTKKVKNCKKRVKEHVHRSFKPVQKVCETSEARVIKDKVQNVCTVFSKDKVRKFKTKYKLDVYLLSAGDGGSGTRPNLDHDNLIRTINYTIPACEELNIR